MRVTADSEGLEDVYWLEYEEVSPILSVIVDCAGFSVAILAVSVFLVESDRRK